MTEQFADRWSLAPKRQDDYGRENVNNGLGGLRCTGPSFQTLLSVVYKSMAGLLEAVIDSVVHRGTGVVNHQAAEVYCTTIYSYSSGSR